MVCAMGDAIVSFEMVYDALLYRGDGRDRVDCIAKLLHKPARVLGLHALPPPVLSTGWLLEGFTNTTGVNCNFKEWTS